MSSGRLITVGLGRRLPAQVQRMLDEAQVDVAVDIRLLRDSVVPSFRGEAMALLVEETGTPYLHRPGLAPARFPEKAIGGVRDERELAMLGHALRHEKRVILICACEATAGCHRVQLADEMRRRLPELAVRHL
jgi:hypothetical protein